MTQESHYLIERGTQCQLLYDADLLRSPKASLLNNGVLEQAESYQRISSGGRGQAWFLQIDGLSSVLRAYQRGGLVARFNQCAYFGLRAENSRAFKEWRILRWMLDKDLPVPRPIAASVCRWPFSLSPFYRAHILVERIPNALTFDQRLSQQALEVDLWTAVGECIARFHSKGIYHADLNANNILIDNKDSVYLIDFDKAQQRHRGSWTLDNLQRLKRSLLKQQTIHPDYHYSESAWAQLIRGYESIAVD